MYYDLVSTTVVDTDHPNTPVSIYAGFYLIMSQYFKNVKVAFGSKDKELRLSYFEIEPSRSGKGERAKVCREVLEKLGYKCVVVTKITSAGLIGSVDDKAIEYNYKNKLKRGDKDFKDPVIYGDLKNNDVLFFPEAKKLLQMNDNDDTLSDLQEALDYPGTIRKKLRNGEMKYDCTCSLYCMTYMLFEVTETLKSQGFFQRIILRIKDFTSEENHMLREKIIDRYKTSSNIATIYNEKLNKFCEELKKIDNTEKTLYLDDSAIEFLKRTQHRFKKEIDKTQGSEMQVMMSFSQTIIDLSIKIGGINACLAQRNHINEGDINSAFIFVKASADSLMNRITTHKKDENTDYKNIIRLFRMMYEQDKEINKEKFVDFLTNNKIGMGRNKLLSIINEMVRRNYFKLIKGDKNIYYLMINSE